MRLPAEGRASEKLFVVQDHAGTFINIAAAKGKDQITGLGIPIDIIRHGLEGGQADTAGDLFAQILRGDVVGIDLPAAMMGERTTRSAMDRAETKSSSSI